MAKEKLDRPHAHRPLTETADGNYCCTNTHPEAEYESRLGNPSLPLSAQVCQQVYAGGRNGAMSFGELHKPDPQDNIWPNTSDRFGSLLRKGSR